MMPKEVLVLAVLVILGIVFIACLVLFVYICRSRHAKKMTSEILIPNGPTVEDFRLHPNIEQILMRDLLMDTTELEPQCLAILRSCHKVTEILSAIAVSLVHNHKLQRVAEVARQTSDRVDDVIRSMYPPVDSRLLEARAVALVLTVSHLATLMHFTYKHNQKVAKEIERELAAVEPFLQELRSAAKMVDANAIAELQSSSGGKNQ
ncbi:transmembrane protein 98-like [Neocloeon triangulifer]|uniref:transmembrane protein 98-like n=1 Tax=Neocloeon triangulifer TaxID=2078957 RepID=UPI00286F191C|nr:transmembrane protein 98-like [Neocloeon triangulifer]